MRRRLADGAPVKDAALLGEKMKKYWLIVAAIGFALIVGALTPPPRDRVTQASATAESHVVRVDPDNGYDWRAPPTGGEKKF